MRRALIIVSAVFFSALLAYQVASSPGKVVVNVHGEIVGIPNRLREHVQGRRFWREQLRQAKSEHAWLLDEPMRQAEFKRMTDEFTQEIARLTLDSLGHDDDLEFEPPRPSAAKQKAIALREEADRIEHEEFLRYLEEHRLARIAELEVIISLARSKAEASR